MKKALGIVLAIIGIVGIAYFSILGMVYFSIIFGLIMGVGLWLVQMRDFAILQSELKEENGTFRLHVTVKNKQKRATLIWFVANIYYRGASVGLANSTNLVLDSYGTGELVALVQLPMADARLEDISWKIVRWNFK